MTYKKMAETTVKRLLPLLEPEKQNGNIEYQRQIQNVPSNSVQSLTKQMVYRLDQGNGCCTYQLGVEDDGRHSLMDYNCMADSACILEAIAHSLNAVVTERIMIQGEVTMDKEGKPLLKSGAEPSIVHEPSIFQEEGNGIGEISQEGKFDPDAFRIKAKADVFTRCKVSIRRIETHLLGPLPSSLSIFFGEKSRKEPSAKKEINKQTTAKNEKDSVSETLTSRNIRIAVVGNVDAGKSTMIGTLTTSCLDDGRGKSRLAIMKHRHEIESGRTSTSSTHLMGFRSNGEPVGGKNQNRTVKRRSEDEVARESHRIITLMDLAGHEKYLKTTIHGVSSGMADYALILVNSRHPPTHMTQHHLSLCCNFGIPVVVIFTKIDGCPEHAYKNSKKEVVKLLRSPEIGKKPYAVKNEKDIETCIGNLHSLTPLIDTSCVTGHGIDLLQKLLFALPKRRRHEKKVNRPFEFLVEDIFNVPGVGGVVSGFVNAGELTVGANSHVYVGPTDDGSFMKTVAKSAHIARINTSHVTSGQSACLAFSLNKEMRKKLRRGMVVLRDSPTSTKEFDAEICVLKGEGTTIRRSYQAYVHILNVRQTAFARKVEVVNNGMIAPSTRNNSEEKDGDGIALRPGSRAKVRFEFAQRPEYIRAGMRMLFRDGRVRGVGIITGVPEVMAVN